MSDALQRLIERVETGERGPGLDTASVFGDGQTAMDAVDAFDGSLDAAKALHDALLPNWVWWFEPFREIAFCGVYNPEISPLPFTSGDVCPARAWLLAILRAYQQVQQ